MQEEIKQEMRTEETVVDNTNYIEAIKDLKQNSVDKATYESLKEENKKLLDALVNGQELDTNTESELGKTEDYVKAYKENKFNNDLEYWENFLSLREATIRDYGKDPCISGSYNLTPDGQRLEPAYGEEEAVNEAMNTIKGFIEESAGDPVVFETLMQSAMKIKKR